MFKFNKPNLIVFLRIYKFYILFIISIFFLLFISPIFDLVFLYLIHSYLLYENGLSLKDLINVWLPTLICWFILFIVSMSLVFNNTMIIGGIYTKILFNFMLLNLDKFYFKTFCFHTVYILHVICGKNSIIIIPIIQF